VWDRKSFLGVELQGKTLGVVGFGRIGQRVAARARGFEMQVVAYDPFLDHAVIRRFDAEPLALDALLARADVVTLHTPLTAETKGLLDARRIGSMKRGAVLVNCARGGVVDEAALLQALEAGRLEGAALDVFADEPPKDFALARHPRVVATPHLGAQTRKRRSAFRPRPRGCCSPRSPARSRSPRSTCRSGAPHARRAVSGARPAARPAGQPAARRQRGGLRTDLWGIEDALRRPLGVAVLKGR
jgi:hypothetical protein